jgi:hypothetical protein
MTLGRRFSRTSKAIHAELEWSGATCRPVGGSAYALPERKSFAEIAAASMPRTCPPGLSDLNATQARSSGSRAGLAGAGNSAGVEDAAVQCP